MIDAKTTYEKTIKALEAAMAQLYKTAFDDCTEMICDAAQSGLFCENFDFSKYSKNTEHADMIRKKLTKDLRDAGYTCSCVGGRTLDISWSKPKDKNAGEDKQDDC